MNCLSSDKPCQANIHQSYICIETTATQITKKVISHASNIPSQASEIIDKYNPPKEKKQGGKLQTGSG